MAPAEDYVSWDTKTPTKIRMGKDPPANYPPMCIQTMFRGTVKEFPDNKVGWKARTCTSCSLSEDRVKIVEKCNQLKKQNLPC